VPNEQRALRKHDDISSSMAIGLPTSVRSTLSRAALIPPKSDTKTQRSGASIRPDRAPLEGRSARGARKGIICLKSALRVSTPGSWRSSISAFFAIWSLMRILERFTAWPFVIYRA